MNLSSQTKRRLVHGGNAVAVILIALGLLATMNFLASRYNKRFDLTQNKLFSVSDQSKKIIGNLKFDVEIELFIPDAFKSYEEGKSAEFLKDLLAEYDSISSKIKVTTINPNKDPNKAKAAGIQYAPAVVIKTNSLTEILYSGNANEQTITASIVKMTKEKTYKVGVIGKKGGHELGKDLNGIKAYLESEGYKVEEVILSGVSDLKNYDALVIAGPEETFNESEKYLIDKYVYEGGNILFALDPLTNTGLTELTSNYGVSFNEDFIIEEQSYFWDLFRGRFNHWPVIIGFSDFQVVRNFNSVLVPLARSLSITSGSTADSSYQEFLKTTPNSWAESDLKSGQAKFDETLDKRGPLTVGVAYIGKVKSVYAGKDLQGISDVSGEGPGIEMTSIDLANQAPKMELGENKEARIIFIGDSDFMSDQYIRNNNNGDLILNSINWLTEDTDLISIRPKEADDRRIKPLDQFGQSFVFWINIVGTSILVLIFGVIRYFLVKRYRNSI